MLLFAWRKAFRESRLCDPPPVRFAPAVVGTDPLLITPSALSGGRMELVMLSGWRLIR
jgi:hypothetical protein